MYCALGWELCSEGDLKAIKTWPMAGDGQKIWKWISSQRDEGLVVLTNQGVWPQRGVRQNTDQWCRQYLGQGTVVLMVAATQVGSLCRGLSHLYIGATEIQESQ